jgi:hypothetical protein
MTQSIIAAKEQRVNRYSSTLQCALEITFDKLNNYCMQVKRWYVNCLQRLLRHIVEEFQIF